MNDASSSTGTSDAKMNGRSYEMIWFTARIALSRAYLLLEPQPAMKMATTPMPPSAKTKSRPRSLLSSTKSSEKGKRATEPTTGAKATSGAR